MQAVPRGRYLLFAALALGGCSLDLLTKSWVFARLGMPGQNQNIWLIDQVLGLTTSLNEGALFGIGHGRGMLFSALSIVAIVGIVGWLFFAGAARDGQLTFALGLVTGGILGNLYDRLGLPGLVWPADMLHEPGAPVYAVRDWIHFKLNGLVDWPIFNIADSLLVCGAGLLIWHAMRADQMRLHHDSDMPESTERT